MTSHIACTKLSNVQFIKHADKYTVHIHVPCDQTQFITKIVKTNPLIYKNNPQAAEILIGTYV